MKRIKLTAFFAMGMAVLLLLALLPFTPPVPAHAAVTMEGVDAMLIYNPRLTYDYYGTGGWTYDLNTMNTGSLAGSGIVTTGVTEPSEVGETPPLLDRPEGDFDRKPLAEYLARGGKLERDYLPAPSAVNVGDTAQFFGSVYNSGGSSTYAKKNFTARAVGTSCIIWGTSDFTNTSLANQMATEYDSKIYPQSTLNFGAARFMPAQKLNILVYDMSQYGPGGFFWGMELFTGAELQSIYGQNPNNWNHSAPYFHLNSRSATAGNMTWITVALAHEFQHMQHFSAALDNPNNAWLESSMSLTDEGFAMMAAELVYPGNVAASGYPGTYTNSTTHVSGTAPYNWNGGAANNSNYGIGWVFMDWWAGQAGNTAFGAYLNYWRSAGQLDLLDPNAFHAATPSAKRTEILNIATYAPATHSSFAQTPRTNYDGYNRSNNEFLSKMLLAFQIATVVQANGGLYQLGSGAHGKVTHPRYRSTAAATIEGGGCIYIKVNGSFTVPAGANAELIYVGFKDGQVVIPPTLAADYTPPPAPLRGDANCDGKVEADDAALVLRALAGLATLSPQGELNADVTGGGVGAEDAAMILRFLAGLITAL